MTEKATYRIESIRQRLDRMPRSTNWDSYGADPTSPAACNAAWALLAEHDPTLVPTQDGGISIEWIINGQEITLECGPSGRWRAMSFDAGQADA